MSDRIKLYVHVVPSTQYYWDFTHGKGSSSSTAADPDRHASAAFVKTENGPKESHLEAEGADLAHRHPATETKLLLIFDKSKDTVKTLRELALAKYAHYFAKIRKVTYIDYAFDSQLYALDDDYKLSDCFADGDTAVVVGTRLRTFRAKKSSLGYKSGAEDATHSDDDDEFVDILMDDHHEDVEVRTDEEVPSRPSNDENAEPIELGDVGDVASANKKKRVPASKPRKMSSLTAMPTPEHAKQHQQGNASSHKKKRRRQKEATEA